MRTSLTPLTISSRAAITAKLREHDDAINTLEAGGTAAAGFAAVNGDSVTLAPGMPIAIGIASGSVQRGNATSQATSSILGLVIQGAAQTLPVRVQPDGAMTLATSAWSAVIGESGGLTPGARYYLATSPGTLTTTPPGAPGTCVTAIGRALAADTLILHICPYVVQ